MNNSKLYLIRSRDRAANTSSHTFGINLAGDPVEKGIYHLQFANIQNTSYTIRSGINDVIYFNENATNKTATVTQGYYTSSSIVTAIKSAMDTASGGFATYTVTFSASTQKITIASTQNFSLTFGTNTNSSIARLIGFNAANTSAATSAISNNVINLSEPLSFAIRIREASEYNVSCINGSYASFVIPMDVGYGEYKYFRSEFDFPQYCTFANKQTRLNIEIRDFEGNLLDLNGSDFELCLRKIN
jgi:hypothetical protein